MNRDILLATLIGLGIGLLLTGAILMGPSMVQNLPQWKFPTLTLPRISLPQFSFLRNSSNPPVTPTPTPLPRPQKITIVSPLDESIADTAQILISGTTADPGSIVVIAGLVDETAVTSDSEGKYAGVVTLEEGKNEILVTTHTPTAQMNASVTVYYTKEKF